jgi:hypothetical protein
LNFIVANAQNSESCENPSARAVAAGDTSGGGCEDHQLERLGAHLVRLVSEIPGSSVSRCFASIAAADRTCRHRSFTVDFEHGQAIGGKSRIAVFSLARKEEVGLVAVFGLAPRA